MDFAKNNISPLITFTDYLHGIKSSLRSHKSPSSTKWSISKTTFSVQ